MPEAVIVRQRCLHNRWYLQRLHWLDLQRQDDGVQYWLDLYQPRWDLQRCSMQLGVSYPLHKPQG